MLPKDITMNDKATILIVDNSIKNIELQKACLKPFKYKILTASNGKQALKTVADNNIDLILLDVTIPEKDSLAVTKYLKSNEKTCVIPVILVTAQTGKTEKLKGLVAESDDFISKPVDMLELTARVNSLIKVKSGYDHMRNSELELESEVTKEIKTLNTALIMIEGTALETIHRLAAAAERRDQYTSSHILRVSHYAAAIAQKMSLNNGFVKALLYAAPLHDIGKIGIPDRILVKPSQLNKKEWEVMQRHTVIGAKLLNGSNQDYMKLAEEIALTHHEKWNGTGYPQGLAREHIPISGRIAAVADVFDALISERPYKPSLSTRESFTIIKNEKGTHFDPHIIDVFISIKHEILSIVDQYKDSV
jgi:putative two-component system response regulator